ncbi:MAG: tetratricopeptide repeat protein [Calothrix sp. SM1_7_51]|nr:tetratricopeptide repeat protein [Calothrix sp. SM1_7_51]
MQDWHREEKLPIKVQCLSHLAYWHREQENWKEARFLYVKALWMCKRLSKEKDITLAESYHNLATVYYEQYAPAYYKKAEAWYRVALKLSQELLGEEHLTIATISTSLAKVYLLQERYENAQARLKMALNIKIKLLENHRQIVQDMKLLGDINHLLKNYKESKKWYSQALEMLKILIKKNHPSINNKDDELIQELERKLDNLADV